MIFIPLWRELWKIHANYWLSHAVSFIDTYWKQVFQTLRNRVCFNFCWALRTKTRTFRNFRTSALVFLVLRAVFLVWRTSFVNSFWFSACCLGRFMGLGFCRSRRIVVACFPNSFAIPAGFSPWLCRAIMTARSCLDSNFFSRKFLTGFDCYNTVEMFLILFYFSSTSKQF